MTLSGLWTRKSSPKESNPEPSPPSPASAPRWARLRAKLSHRKDNKTEDSTAPLDTSAATKKSTGVRKRHLVSQIISFRPSEHPPRQRTPRNPSQDNDALLTRTENSSTSRSVSQDSSPLLPECDNPSFTAIRADTLGATGSAECNAPLVYIEANTGEVINAAVSESQHFPSIPSSDPVSFIDRSENIPKRDLGFAGNPESFEALFQHQSDEVSACLRSAEIIKSKRRRLRVEARRARRSSPEVIIHDFSIVLNALGSIGSAEGDGPRGESEGDQSASGEAEPSPAVAPVSTISPLHSTAYESVVQGTPSGIQSSAEASTGLKSLKHDMENSCSRHPRSRDSQASSSSSESPFKYDYPPSVLPRADNPSAAGSVENHAPLLDSREAETADCEGSPSNLVDRCLSPARSNNLGLTGSAETDGGTVDREGNMSAAAEARSSSGVAPTPTPDPLRPEPGGIVILVTPPSPPTTIRPSLSQRYVKNRVVDLENSHLAPHDHRTSNLPAKSGHPGFGSRRAETRSATSSAENLSPALKTEKDEGIGCAAGSSQYIPYSGPSKRPTSKAAMGLVDREIDGDDTPVKNSALSTSHRSRPPPKTPQPFGFSGNSTNDFSHPVTLEAFDTTGLTGNEGQTVGREEDASAAGEAEPSPRVAPTFPTAALRRKPREVPGVTERFVLGPVRQQARALKARVVSSLRKWGNTASRRFNVRRPTKLEENETFNPYFDPYYEGFVPPRGPSPDPIQPDGEFPPPQPSIMNIYVKLD